MSIFDLCTAIDAALCVRLYTRYRAKVDNVPCLALLEVCRNVFQKAARKIAKSYSRLRRSCVMATSPRTFVLNMASMSSGLMLPTRSTPSTKPALLTRKHSAPNFNRKSRAPHRERQHCAAQPGSYPTKTQPVTYRRHRVEHLRLSRRQK